MDEALSGLTARQRELLACWVPGFEVRRDLSWGLVETTVLEVDAHGERLIVKAGGPGDHHLARELRAHRRWVHTWVASGVAADLRHGDVEAKLLVRPYLPGDLVQDSPAERTPEVYRQAGALLAELHGQAGVVSNGFEADERAKTLAWLDRPHRIERATEQRLRSVIAQWPTPPAVLVPTHGDWQPRNWLIDGSTVRIIDFGRADLRPAYTDFARLAAQQFRGAPDLEAAFLAGYGGDPREPAAWQRNRIREAVATAAWAHQVGDERFEQQGIRMIAEALADEED